MSGSNVNRYWCQACQTLHREGDVVVAGDPIVCRRAGVPVIPFRFPVDDRGVDALDAAIATIRAAYRDLLGDRCTHYWARPEEPSTTLRCVRCDRRLDVLRADATTDLPYPTSGRAYHIVPVEVHGQSYDGVFRSTTGSAWLGIVKPVYDDRWRESGVVNHWFVNLMVDDQGNFLEAPAGWQIRMIEEL